MKHEKRENGIRIVFTQFNIYFFDSFFTEISNFSPIIIRYIIDIRVLYMKVITQMQPKQAYFHRIMLIVTASLLFLLFASHQVMAFFSAVQR